MIDGQALREMLGERLERIPAPSSRGTEAVIGEVLRQAPRLVRGYRRAVWRIDAAVVIGKVVIVMVVAGVLYFGVRRAIDSIATARGPATVSAPLPAAAVPAVSKPIAAAPFPLRLTAEQRALRREEVRRDAARITGVTSVVWLGDRRLLLGMRGSSVPLRGEAMVAACALIANYPELRPAEVEAQDTGGTWGNTGIQRIRCG